MPPLTKSVGRRRLVGRAAALAVAAGSAVRRAWRWLYFFPRSAERDLRAKTLRQLRNDDFGRAVARNLTAFYPIKPNLGSQPRGQNADKLSP